MRGALQVGSGLLWPALCSGLLKRVLDHSLE